MTDLTAAPRPVPTTEDRMRDARTDRTFATYLDRHDRDQLDARAATAEQERDEARDDRDVLRQQLDTARAELGAAQELLAVVDDLAEQLDRARARYATQQRGQYELDHAGETIPASPAVLAAAAGLGSPQPRAQEQPVTAAHLAEHLYTHQWYSKPEFPLLHEPSAHREHVYNSDCAICRGDLSRIAAVALAYVQARL